MVHLGEPLACAVTDLSDWLRSVAGTPQWSSQEAAAQSWPGPDARPPGRRVRKPPASGAEKSTVSSKRPLPARPRSSSTRRQRTPRGALCSLGTVPLPPLLFPRPLTGSTDLRVGRTAFRHAAISSQETAPAHPPFSSCQPLSSRNLIEPASPWLTDKTTHHGPNSASASEAAPPGPPREIDAPRSGAGRTWRPPSTQGADCGAAWGRVRPPGCGEAYSTGCNERFILTSLSRP